MIEIQVHQRILSLCVESCDGSSSTAQFPIPFGAEILDAISSTLVRLQDTARFFVAQPQLCWDLIEVQVHQNCLGAYPYDRSITAYFRIQVVVKSVSVILATTVRIWDIGKLIRSKVAGFAGIALKFGHTSSPYHRMLHTETRLSYLRLSCCICHWVFLRL